GGHAGDRFLRCGQRGASGRGHPCPEVSRDSRRSRRVPQGADRFGGRIAAMSVSDLRPGRSAEAILPPAPIAVIGDGQLGRMFLQAAQRVGDRAGVLPANGASPAAQLAHWSVIGDPDELSALRALADQAQAVTVEFENVSAPALRWLARRLPTRPGWRTLWV